MHTGTTKILFSISLRVIYSLMILAMLISAVWVNPAAAQDIPNGQLASPSASDNFSVQNGPALSPHNDPSSNEIVVENSKPGSPPSEWDVSGAGDETIQGFATDISVNRDQTINFKIDTTAAAYDIKIYRLGYYGGNGARLVHTIAGVTGTEQPACLLSDIEIGGGGITGGQLLDCGNWSISASWAVPADATSGVYIARPTRTDGGASHIPFIVRNDTSHSDLLFQTSDTTWQSYNVYGGYNAYGSSGATMAEKLSYNRPFTTRGAELENYLFNAEYPMIRWLERNGYDVGYMSAVDTERHASLVLNHKVFMSIGHDEYWSQGRRDAVTAARDAGVHLAFFSGNEVYWKTRWEASTADGGSTDYRTQVVYKEGNSAPSGSVEHRNCYNNFNCDPSPIWTGQWREAPGSTPENSLSGNISWRLNEESITVPGEYAPLRFWRNTDVALLTPSDQITLANGTLGYEWDPEYPQYADWYPAGRVLLSTTTATSFTGIPEQHHLSLYRAPSNALVFGAGTVQWSWGLDANHDRGTSTEDKNVQQATVNLFADMGAQPGSLQTDLTAAAASTDTNPPTVTVASPASGASIPGGAVTITGTASDIGGAVGVVEISTNGGTTWRRATGTANWSYTYSAVEGTADIRVRAADDSINLSSPITHTFMVEPRVCPCSIWNDAVTPSNSGNDGQSIEVGVKFQSSETGYVTGLRFYKSTSNTGTNTGHLWASDGTQLAAAIFVNETTSGWQEVHFDIPVQITANTTYVASYHSSGGGYSYDDNYFTTAYDSSPLRALANGEEGGNGVYKMGTSGFPTTTYQGSNYWVDVIFDTTLQVYSVWEEGSIAGSPSVNDANAIEAGLKFKSDVPGSISGIMFYKGIGNTGPFIGHLWALDGTPLAAKNYANSTADVGWQEILFDAPVHIAANTTYVASYFTQSGYYAAINNYFTSEIYNAPLHALANNDPNGPNGVYNYQSSGFPTSTFQSSNYWVDVLFTPDTPLDLTPPSVASTTPLSGQVDVSTTVNVQGIFSESMDATTINESNFELRNGSNNLVSAAVTYDSGTRTATLDPTSLLANSSTYTAKIKGGTGGMADLAGNELTADYSWSFTTSAPTPPPPDDGPGGPILIISSASNPFSRYYTEVLRAEGLNEFLAVDVSSVNATLLSGYQVAILGEMTLTPDQVTMLTTWVNAGGNLIAMRPDFQLSSLLGLTTASGALSNGYLLVNTSSAPGAGIVNQTIQYHDTADRYTLSGATAVAALYSDSTTATSNPAVTLVNVGSNGGQAAAFTYDLAKSIVYTRQGNPAWKNINGDGSDGPVRADDMFHNGTDPDWVNLDKIAIPQADEQQRLLANLILTMNQDNNPLPRFWYFPRSEKAVVVMTADDHASSNVSGRLEQYKAASPVGCSVNDWECVRSSVYVYSGSALTAAQANAYTAEGFEIGVHVLTDCANYNLTELENFYTTQLDDFATRFPALPQQDSERTHCIAWSDWALQADVKEQKGIRLDTNYYFWPPTWVLDRPGMFTGSGMPMRFADIDGTMFDVYQAITQMTDESGQAYPYTIDTLLDRALGSEGYYGVFTANMHSDSMTSAGSNAIVASAQTRGVPIVSGRQMLEWLDGRNASSFANIAWSVNNLSFDVNANSGASGLQALLPAQNGSLSLQSLTRGGTPVTFMVETIKGVSYARFAASSGAYVAQYASDTTPPIVTSVTPLTGATDVALNAAVTATFSKSIDPLTLNAGRFELLGPGNVVVPATVSYTATTATLTPNAALAPNTVYTVKLKGGTGGVSDVAGNLLVSDYTWSFTTAADTCPCSIWDKTLSVGANPADAASYELGVKFRSSQDGSITALRFYKYLGNTGTHVGRLWNISGNLLGSATFTNETTSGWQEVTLNPPVAITANTIYVASYSTDSGNYAFSGSYFTLSGVNNGPLYALSASEAPAPGRNGVLNETPGSFPNLTFNDANYWVDVVFDTALPGDTTPPMVTAVTPISGATGVAVNTTVTATFSEAIDPLTLNAGGFELLGPGNAVVPTAVSYNGTTATLTPNAALAPNTQYTAKLKGGTGGVSDAAGNLLAADYSWSFTTASDNCPCSIWDNTGTPTTSPVNDNGQPIEVGTKFRSDTSGYITSLRYYKGAGDTDTHVGHLWVSTGGSPLATVTFTGGTASGWQEMALPSPVSIIANTTYIVSIYSSPLGNFAITLGGLTNAVTNSPLKALAAGEDGPNGVYRYGGGFPNGGNNANYWVDAVFKYSIVLDTTPPTITTRTPAPNATGVAHDANVTMTFSEAMNPGTITGTTITLRASGAGSDVPATVNYASGVATLNPTADLLSNTLYQVTVSGTVTDEAGNLLGSNATWSFTTSNQTTVTDTTSADFSAGTLNACFVDNSIGDGAVRLSAGLNEDFSDSALPAADWTNHNWTGAPPFVNGGSLTVDGAEAYTTTQYGLERTLEFVATFNSQPYQHIGFGGTPPTAPFVPYNGAPWIMFSTSDDAAQVYARVMPPGSSAYNTGNDKIPIGNYIGSPHTYRIDWMMNSIDFYVDGELKTTVTTTISGPMNVAVSDYQSAIPSLSVDWLRMSPPYASPCTFESRIFNAGAVVDWQELTSTMTTPAGTSVAFETRSGNASTPDGTWSAWQAVNSPIASPNGQYIQYRASLATTDTAQTPVIESVILTYSAAPNTAPQAMDDTYTIAEDGTLTIAAPGVLANDTDIDPGDTITAVKVNDPSHGALALNADGSFTYTPVPDYDGADTFTYKANDGEAYSNIAIVSVTVNALNDAPVITGQSTLSTNEDTPLSITLADITVEDADNTYPTGFGLTVQNGANYTVVDSIVTPTHNFHGTLSIPIKVNDGLAGSNIYNIQVTVIDVLPTNANAGGPYTAVAGQPVTLNGSATCASMDTCTYAWDLDGDAQYDDAIVISPIHIWNTASDYTVGLQVTDDDENSIVATASVTITPATHSIALAPGWNLVSFNLRPTSTAIASVLASLNGNYDLVYTWNAGVTTNNWLKYAPSAPGYSNSLNNLDETMGFWVHMTAADTLEVTGSVPVTTGIALSANAGGWNLVAYPSGVDRPLPEALSANGIGTDFSLMYAYHANEPADPWKLFGRTAPVWANDLTELAPGWGYWVKINADHAWSVKYLAD